MKTQTLTDRIKKHLTTAKGEIAKYADVEKVLLGNRVHGKDYSGRGRYTSVTNGKYYSTIEGLKAIGVDYQTGNDAPRGGAIGDYIELTAKGKRQVAEWAKTRKAELAAEDAKKKAALAAKKARRVAAIKERYDILVANPDTVAKYFPNVPTYTSGMGKQISKNAIGGKMWGLAKELHTLKDDDLFVAISFYFLKGEYSSVHYGEKWADRYEINYSDIAA